MKRILVPTDFSSAANAASDVAIRLATHLRASIYFLHLSEEPVAVEHHVMSHGAAAHFSQNPQVGQALESLNELTARAGKEGLEAFPVYVTDDGNQRIEDFVKPYQIDLIVMGSHGYHGLRKLIVGSNTRRLIYHSTVPVLVIKEPIARISSILFASTFTNDITKAYQKVLEFSTAFHAQLHVLKVRLLDVEVNEAEVKSRVDWLKSQVPVDTSFNHADTNDEDWSIAHVCDLIGSDIIALTRDEKSGAVRIFPHHTAERLIETTRHPVLVL